MLPVIDTEVAIDELRARPGAARKPAGVRQDRGYALSSFKPSAEASLAQASRARRAPASARGASMPSSAGSRSAMMRLLRRADRKRTANFVAGASCARSVPGCAEHRVGTRQSRGRLSGEIGRRRSKRSSPASGTISAVSRSNSCTSTGSRSWIRTSRAMSTSSTTTLRWSACARYATPGPRLFFGTHLAKLGAARTIRPPLGVDTHDPLSPAQYPRGRRRGR